MMKILIQWWCDKDTSQKINTGIFAFVAIIVLAFAVVISVLPAWPDTKRCVGPRQEGGVTVCERYEERSCHRSGGKVLCSGWRDVDPR